MECPEGVLRFSEAVLINQSYISTGIQFEFSYKEEKTIMIKGT